MCFVLLLQGFVQHDANAAQGMPQGGAQQISMFDVLNQRLLDNGIPRWNLGPYVVEPIASLGFLVALLLVGFRGLLFALLLFFVVKYSSGRGMGDIQNWFGGRGGTQQGGPGSGGGGGAGGGRGGGFGFTGGSGGQRLGRN